MTARAVTVGTTSYPLVLPNIRDPRLHVAAVILTIHAFGQIGLGFAVSVPQILAAIVTCAIIEIVLTFRQTRSFVWPASAMLTGSGIALILRIGTAPDDHWSLNGWWVYAGVAGLALLTKYVIKYRGTHVFNPSNLGLVAAFVLLGSTRVEPLDFWWAPITNIWMILAYVVIIGGGLLITRRLHLLALAASFYVTLTIGTAILAGSGHCMVTEWAFGPVCDIDYFRTIVTSPEVLIFLFFMITDPKTVPGGRVARVVFGMLVAICSILLMAPQTNEFGTKVALLSGLVVMCAARPILERVLPTARTADDSLRLFAGRVVTGGRPRAGALRVGLRAGALAVVVLALGAGIVFAGTPARGVLEPDVAEILARVPTHVDPATLPAITVSQAVGDYDLSIVGPGAAQLVVLLDQNLEIENEALLRHDQSILPAVDHGDRLDQMTKELSADVASGRTTISTYRIDTVNMSLLQPFGRQNGLSLGLDSKGTVTNQVFDAAGHLQSESSAPFAQMFVIRRATGGRWLNVAILPPGSTG